MRALKNKQAHTKVYKLLQPHCSCIINRNGSELIEKVSQEYCKMLGADKSPPSKPTITSENVDEKDDEKWMNNFYLESRR